MRHLAWVIIAVMSGCVSAPRGPGPTYGIQEAVPSDAGWPPVALDAAALSNLSPLWMRIETAWSGPLPEDVSVASVVAGDVVASRNASVQLGSVSTGPGYDPNRTLSLNLSGGVTSLVDPSDLGSKHLAFAGRVIDVPTVARQTTLRLIGTQNGTAFELGLDLAPRANAQTTGPLYAISRNGTLEFGMLPHPGGFLHPLEDAALLVWASGSTVFGVGQGVVPRGDLGNAEPLQVLVLTGMDGWVERVAVESG